MTNPRSEEDGVNHADAAAYIRTLIATGVAKPGTRVPPERELAATLGTSRSSVREAIRELTSQGILVARRGAGTYVTSLEDRNLFSPLEFAVEVDAGLLMHMYELRRIIEPAAAALAASRAEPEELARLDAAGQTYIKAAADGLAGIGDLIRADIEVHDIIAGSTRNPLIGGVLRGLRELSAYGRVVTSASPGSAPDGVVEIGSIVHAVLGRDPLLAHAAMATHIARTEDRARRALADQRAKTTSSDGSRPEIGE